MTMYVLYAKPKDYPDEFVCRRHIPLNATQTAAEADLFARAGTLEELRKMLPGHLVNTGRYQADDPAIAEVWV